jgi:hypothetical protein
VLYAQPIATASQLAHELMHHHDGVGLGAYLRVMAEVTGSAEVLRLAEITVTREEAPACAFEIALFMPWRMVLRHSDNELADLASCSTRIAWRRRREVLRWCNQRGIDPADVLRCSEDFDSWFR